jgi:hypothetical protein
LCENKDITEAEITEVKIYLKKKEDVEKRI